MENYREKTKNPDFNNTKTKEKKRAKKLAFLPMVT